MIEINSYNEFLNIIHNNPDIYIFIDYWAPWCKPCIKLFPLIEKLEKNIKLKNLIFYKINIDENCECVDNCNINSIPRCSLYYNGVLLEFVSGSNIQNIGKLLNNNITNKVL